MTMSSVSLFFRETRVQRDREEKNDRSILKSVINVWKEIKHQREFQKFTNTPAQLKVVKFVFYFILEKKLVTYASISSSRLAWF